MEEALKKAVPRAAPVSISEQMRTLSLLNDHEKEKYEMGLRGLYDQMEKNGPETQPHQNAKQKIMEFSRMVAQKIDTLRQRQQGRRQLACDYGEQPRLKAHRPS